MEISLRIVAMIGHRQTTLHRVAPFGIGLPQLATARPLALTMMPTLLRMHFNFVSGNLRFGTAVNI